ncbi:MAG: YtxH domain-containing protein [Lacibacter sp.]|jgi:gas vesicle protein
MNNAGKIAIAVAAGAVIGGVLGVLFAPDKGTDTRKKIVDGVKKIPDTVKEKFNGLRVNIKDKADSLKEKAEELV